MGYVIRSYHAYDGVGSGSESLSRGSVRRVKGGVSEIVRRVRFLPKGCNLITRLIVRKMPDIKKKHEQNSESFKTKL